MDFFVIPRTGCGHTSAMRKAFDVWLTVVAVIESFVGFVGGRLRIKSNLQLLFFCVMVHRSNFALIPR